MKSNYLPVIFLVIAVSASAQFTENFTDDNFDMHPTWLGDTVKFTVNMGILRLQAPSTTGEAYLSTPSKAISNAVWQCTLNLKFNPSSNNYAQIYLVSDKPNLANPLNGYFILIGGTQDDISLYKQIGNTQVKIIDGNNNSVDMSQVSVTVKATRDNKGNWELFSDIGNTGIFVLEGTIFDNTLSSSTYFGIRCHYTSTRSDKFYFDDFEVRGNPGKNRGAPTVQAVNIISNTQIQVDFNEFLELTSARTTSNYSVNNGIGNPYSAEIENNLTTVKLGFIIPLKNGLDHELTITGVSNVNGLSILDTTITFFYFHPVPSKNKDIIITEIHANPNVLTDTPDIEFIELYNRKKDVFDLAGWTLSDYTTEATFPKILIPPNTYLIVTSQANSLVFRETINVIGIPSFPSLNNRGDVLTLKNDLNQTIDSVQYELSWYHNMAKQEGGWSLELIDLENLCSEKENWTASENERGSTPGEVNSVLANKPDRIGPKLLSATALSKNRIQLTFDEKLEQPISPSASFTLIPAAEIKQYGFDSSTLRSISLYLNSPLIPKQLYTLQVDNVFDCSGNPIQKSFNQLKLALPEKAISGDMLINEVLFNPRPNGVDFVEVYNLSNKYIDLQSWGIANFDKSNGQVINLKLISDETLIIQPQAYFVFTTNSSILKNHYPQGIDNTFKPVALPTLPDQEGSVVLVEEKGAIMDSLFYDEGFHSIFIQEREGVSLERVSFSRNIAFRKNWHSASSTSGYATPGFINSSFQPQDKVVTGSINITPPAFTPYTGANQFSIISFRFDQSGWVANIRIFDHQSRLIKILANNETLGAEGFFRWDGDRQDGSKARAGYYYVQFSIFNAQGLVKHFRERVVILSP